MTITHQATALRPDPECAITAFEQAPDDAGRQRGHVATVEDRETYAVEANERTLGAEPQVAVAGLGDRADGVGWQAVLLIPDLVDVLVERFAGVERKND